MYRLLIVDDEKIIVSGLYELFCDARHLELDVCKAYSATEALSWFNRTRIDVMLTDIKMPGMDGLQLLDKVHVNWPQCKVIFLTGYDEFEYIYSAIKHKDVRYLLKTEKDEVIINAVEEAINEIEENLKDEGFISKITENMKTALPLLQKEYLSEILIGEKFDSYNRMEKFEEFNIPLNPKCKVMIFIGYIDSLPGSLSTTNKMQYLFMVKEIAERYLSNISAKVIQIVYGGSKMVWFMQPKDIVKTPEGIESEDTIWEKMTNILKGTLETIQIACKNTLQQTVSFVISDGAAEWEKIDEKYKSCNRLLDYHTGFSTEIIVLEKERVFDNESLVSYKSKNSGNMELLHQKTGILLSYLESHQENGFFEILNEITEHLVSIKSMNNFFALELYYSISLSLLSYINRSNMVEKLVFKIGLRKLICIEEHGSWTEACEYLRYLSEYIFNIQDVDQENRLKLIILQISKYIDENPTADMSLTRLADMVYYNPSYFSRAFKKVIGKNLIDYVSDVKMKKGRELLGNSDMKICDIAEYLGYDSSAYFTRAFKKITNQAPQDYRNSFKAK